MSFNYREFPAFGFPRSSTKYKGRTVVDYGIDDIVDINLFNQELNVCSRKSLKQNNERYTSNSMCFPLKNPNNQPSIPVYEELQDCWIKPHEFYDPPKIPNDIKTTNKQQLDRLFTDHPELLIGSFLDQMTEENRKLVNRHFHPLKYSFDVIKNLSSRQNKPEDYRSYFINNLNIAAVNRYDRTKVIASKYSFLRNLDDFMNSIFEIPRELILEYLDEALLDQYDVIMENHQLGNCLSFCEDLILYPQGGMDILRIDPVSITSAMDNFDIDDNTCMELNSSQGQSIEMTGAIQELCCQSYDTGQSLVGIRNDYSCALLSRVNQDSMHMQEDRQQLFKTLDTVNTESRVLSLAVNPYYEGDAVISLENGSFYNWADGHLIDLNSKQISTRCSCNELFWVHCCYGSSPKSLVVVHADEVQLFDIRSHQSSCVSMLKLPNPHVNQMDKLTRAAFIHPSNPYQLLLASEQGLIVMDERLTNIPVITINHHMRSSPKFMHTSTYEQDSCLHTMAFLGGYKYRDTRCLEFEQSCVATNEWKCLQNSSSKLNSNPVACIRKPWRLAYCDSWLDKYSNDSRVLSPAIQTRLKQPLIGLGVYHVKNAARDLFAVQVTKSGDLFFEFLRKQPRDDDEDSRPRCDKMTDKMKRKCEDWVSIAFDLYNAEPLLNECAKINSVKVDFSNGKIFDVLETQHVNSEVNARFDIREMDENEKFYENSMEKGNGQLETKSFDKDSKIDMRKHQPESLDIDQHSEQSIQYCQLCKFVMSKGEERCTNCDIYDSVAERVIRISSEGKSLVTNEALGKSVDLMFPKLVKFPEKSKDPLSEVLFINWNNDDDYTPIDLSEKTPANHDDDDDGCLEKKQKIDFTLNDDVRSDQTDPDLVHGELSEDMKLGIKVASFGTARNNVRTMRKAKSVAKVKITADSYEQPVRISTEENNIVEREHGQRIRDTIFTIPHQGYSNSNPLTDSPSITTERPRFVSDSPHSLTTLPIKPIDNDQTTNSDLNVVRTLDFGSTPDQITSETISLKKEESTEVIHPVRVRTPLKLERSSQNSFSGSPRKKKISRVMGF